MASLEALWAGLTQKLSVEAGGVEWNCSNGELEGYHSGYIDSGLGEGKYGGWEKGVVDGVPVAVCCLFSSIFQFIRANFDAHHCQINQLMVHSHEPGFKENPWSESLKALI